MDWLFADLGIRAPDLVAGFAGGVVNAFVLKRRDPWSVLGALVVGALTAAYLTSLVAPYLGKSAPFIVGFAGMVICQSILKNAANLPPFRNLGALNGDQANGPH